MCGSRSTDNTGETAVFSYIDYCLRCCLSENDKIFSMECPGRLFEASYTLDMHETENTSEMCVENLQKRN